MKFTIALSFMAMFALLAGGCAETKFSPRFDLDAGADADALGDGSEEPITFDPLDTYYRVVGDSGLISERLEELSSGDFRVARCELSGAISTGSEPFNATDSCSDSLEGDVYPPLGDLEPTDEALEPPSEMSTEVMAEMSPTGWDGQLAEWRWANQTGTRLYQVWDSNVLLYEMQIAIFSLPTHDYNPSSGALNLGRRVAIPANYEIICPRGHFIERINAAEFRARFEDIPGGDEFAPMGTGTRCVPIPDDFQP